MFRWSYFDDAGEALGVSEEFADRDAAEAWMADTWADLLDRGVEQVELAEGEPGRVLYRMALRRA